MENKETWSFNKKDLFTIPNILTYIRFILIVPFAYYFLYDNYVPAVICIGVSGLTDCFDGMIARRFNQVTSLGKILDPIADKFTLLAVVICMVIKVPIVLPVLITLLLKDVIMLLGGIDLINKGITPPAAKWYGKLGTLVFYISVCVIVFLKAAFKYENVALDIALLSVTAVIMLFALFQYGKIYFLSIREYNAKIQAKKDES
ncbi:MAG: CDP-alcohol phosphatidyltransferase family protein [Ruminococcus sp.]|nr:CDP-alcohol phosphatidyltransferase family protein [Ruminococcus sp.]